MIHEALLAYCKRHNAELIECYATPGTGERFDGLRNVGPHHRALVLIDGKRVRLHYDQTKKFGAPKCRGWRKA